MKDSPTGNAEKDAEEIAELMQILLDFGRAHKHDVMAVSYFTTIAMWSLVMTHMKIGAPPVTLSNMLIQASGALLMDLHEKVKADPNGFSEAVNNLNKNLEQEGGKNIVH